MEEFNKIERMDGGELKDAPRRFRFRYRNMAFHGRIDLTGPDTARLAVTGILSALPYSVESREMRKLARQLLATAASAGADYIALRGDTTVTFSRETEIARPVSPIDVMTATAATIARAQPVILLFYSLLSVPHRTAPDNGAPISSSAR